MASEFTLESSKAGIRRANLTPYFDFRQPGRYQIIATVKIPQWEKEVVSNPVSFDITAGTKLKELNFGVPSQATNAAPEMRKYILQQAIYLKEMKLYFRLTDSTGANTYRLFPIARMVTFSELGSAGGSSKAICMFFTRPARAPSIIASSILTAKSSRAKSTNTPCTRPTLKLHDDGKIFVAGGALTPEFDSFAQTLQPTNRPTRMHQRNSHNLFSVATLGCLLLALSTLALHSQTVALKLRNGDRISGNIISESTNQIVISNAWTKTLTIPLVEIQSREILTPQIAATNVPPVAVVAKTNAPVVTKQLPPPAAKPVVAVTPAVKPKTPSAWHGDIQLGADVGISETRRQLYHSRFKITYAPVADSGLNGLSEHIDRFRNTFDFNMAYGTTDGILSANRMDGSSKTDFDLGDKRQVFVYNLFGGGYDEIRRIERRYEVGPGIGYHIFTRSNLVLNAEVGLNYQTQNLWSKVGDRPRIYTWNDRFYYRLAEDFTWKISKTLTFDEKFELFPQMDFEEYRFRFESNLRYWILENLSFNLTVLDIYDTQPAIGVGRNDLQIRSSIGVKF